MASLNLCQFIGNLGRDPEVRYMPNGDPVCNFSIACTETWKDKSGQRQESTEWVRIVLYGKLAEIAGQYLKKGSQVYVQGAMKTRKWQDKEGRDQYTTEIVGREMKMLGSRPDGAGDSQQRQAAPAAQQAPAARQSAPSADYDDDIPF